MTNGETAQELAGIIKIVDLLLEFKGCQCPVIVGISFLARHQHLYKVNHGLHRLYLDQDTDFQQVIDNGFSK